MSIIRVVKEGKFFTVSNEPFQDSSLSWEARGVMGYILSKPDSWIVRTHDLVQQGPAGERKIKSILRELKAAGYMSRVQEKPEGNKGRFEWVTVIYEHKQLNPSIVLLRTDGQRTDAQCTDAQRIDAQEHHIVTTQSVKTEPVKTEKEITEREGTSPARVNPLSSLGIYLDETKIKSKSRLPGKIVAWLEEQDWQMATPGRPEALRDAIREADKEGEKLIFDVGVLDMMFNMFNGPDRDLTPGQRANYDRLMEEERRRSRYHDPEQQPDWDPFDPNDPG